MSTLLYIITASILESLVSLTGIFFIFIGYSRFKHLLPNLLSFSVGTFLAVIFFEILPEAVELADMKIVSFFILFGFLFFFLFSRFLQWYHHHEGRCCEHESIKVGGYLVLAGDFVHNFIDGIIIALAFMADTRVGIVTTVAVLAHEFPQEASDFFVMLNSGFSKKKALFMNFLVSLSTLAGALLAYFLARNADILIGPALGIVAGNFLYLSMSDLIPELESIKEKNGTAMQFLMIVLGIVLIYVMSTLIPE
ncbi:ZIP family metal transporter [Patescibacteria group bacterium]|nr:ZIP family metal transporter [Patescibacteria group bacterium]MCG2694481.1 ZIP family metal transporter [Candidatus Parcubacteria bacterium]